jgi:hypothetical protein
LQRQSNPIAVLRAAAIARVLGTVDRLLVHVVKASGNRCLSGTAARTEACLDVGSLRGGIIWSSRRRSKLVLKNVFCPLTCDNETERAGGEWSSAVRRGVADAEGAGRRAGWGGHGRAGGGTRLIPPNNPTR